MRLLSRIRLPSFKTACALCVASLLGLACWAFVDARFGQCIDFLRIDLGVAPDPGMRPELWAQGRREFAWRLGLLAALTVAWLVAMGVMAYRLLAGTSGDRSLMSWLLVFTLIGVSLGTIIGARQLHWRGFEWRIRRIVPGLKEDVAMLERQWPSQNGELPYCGTFHAESANPRILTLNTSENAVRETFGGFVLGLDDGGFAFESSNYRETFVEFHPAGQAPKSFQLAINNRSGERAFDFDYALLSAAEIAPNWYIARYELTSIPDDADETP